MNFTFNKYAHFIGNSTTAKDYIASSNNYVIFLAGFEM